MEGFTLLGFILNCSVPLVSSFFLCLIAMRLSWVGMMTTASALLLMDGWEAAAADSSTNEVAASSSAATNEAAAAAKMWPELRAMMPTVVVVCCCTRASCIAWLSPRHTKSGTHRVHTEWQRPLSGVYSIMMETLAQAGEGGGCTPTPFHCIYHHVQSCGVRSSWEGRYTPPISTLPYMYSVEEPNDSSIIKF